jgi:hypothetical protein
MKYADPSKQANIAPIIALDQSLQKHDHSNCISLCQWAVSHTD